jgi:hypothetical protein
MGAAWIGVVGTAVGAMLGFGGIWLQQIFESRRSDAQREAEYKAKRHEFQRETLLAVQSELTALMGAVTTVFMETRNRLDAAPSAEWKLSPLSSPFAAEIGRANVALAGLVLRVNDDMLRTMLTDFRQIVKHVTFSETKAEAEENLHASIDLHEIVAERLGVVLRELQ